MNEAQRILMWLKDQGMTDKEIAELVGVRRETITRIRNAQGGCTGDSILEALRAITIDGRGYREGTPARTIQIETDGADLLIIGVLGIVILGCGAAYLYASSRNKSDEEPVPHSSPAA